MGYHLMRWRPHPRAKYLPGVTAIVIKPGTIRSLIQWQEPGLLYPADVETDARYPWPSLRYTGRPKYQPTPVIITRQRTVPNWQLFELGTKQRT